jgi:polyvinyl alcohol dehydrogenase (cytochrome)
MPFIVSPARVRRPLVRTVAVAATCALVACACSSGSASRSGAASPDSAVSRTDTARGWRVYRRDLANTGTAATDRTITAANVHTLTKSWSKDGLTGVSGTPAVVDGVAYFGDWNGTLWAVKAATGAEVWHTPIPGGFIVGAPAVDGNGVFLGNGHTLYRVNRNTGAIVWQTSTNESPVAQINGSPVVAGKLVLQTTAGIQDAVPDPTNSFRGTIGAYDKTTGREVWRFYATPNDATAGSGVGIWSTPAVDLGRGLLFVGTGNTSSEPTAPLADALLALHLDTGELEWSRQFTARDVFPNGHPTGKDVDVGASPNLWRSRGKDLVGVGDKGGNYHALDRGTGKPIWQTSLTPGSVFGGVIGSAALVDRTLVMSSNVGDPKTNAPTNASKVFGIDPATGRIRWSTPAPDGKIFAPITAVPGVAFVGTDAGALMALSTRTGKKLWGAKAPDKTSCGPSIVGDRLVWGYGFFLFGGGGAGGVISYTVQT